MKHAFVRLALIASLGIAALAAGGGTRLATQHIGERVTTHIVATQHIGELPATQHIGE